MDEEKEEKKRPSFWQVFYDDIFLIFFLGAAIMFLLYTVWGLAELGSVSPAPYVSG